MSGNYLGIVCERERERTCLYRSLPPEFESRHGHIWMVFHHWLRLITFGGRSAHLAWHVHKSGRKHQSSDIIISLSVCMCVWMRALAVVEIALAQRITCCDCNTQTFHQWTGHRLSAIHFPLWLYNKVSYHCQRVYNFTEPLCHLFHARPLTSGPGIKVEWNTSGPQQRRRTQFVNKQYRV